MDFIDTKTVLTIVHVFGAIIGAGGAYMSDLMFFSSIKDEKIEPLEFKFMRLGSRMVWLGLIILIVSGIGLFLTDVDKYMHSTKFLAKMTIVGIIFVNGVFFHLTHLPRMRRHQNTHLPSSDEFSRKAHLLVASGAISFISWTTSVIFGSLKSIPYSYSEIMLGYLIIVAVAVALSIPLFKKQYHF